MYIEVWWLPRTGRRDVADRRWSLALPLSPTRAARLTMATTDQPDNPFIVPTDDIKILTGKPPPPPASNHFGCKPDKPPSLSTCPAVSSTDM